MLFKLFSVFVLASLSHVDVTHQTSHTQDMCKRLTLKDRLAYNLQGLFLGGTKGDRLYLVESDHVYRMPISSRYFNPKSPRLALFNRATPTGYESLEHLGLWYELGWVKEAMAHINITQDKLSAITLYRLRIQHQKNIEILFDRAHKPGDDLMEIEQFVYEHGPNNSGKLLAKPERLVNWIDYIESVDVSMGIRSCIWIWEWNRKFEDEIVYLGPAGMLKSRVYLHNSFNQDVRRAPVNDSRWLLVSDVEPPAYRPLFHTVPVYEQVYGFIHQGQVTILFSGENDESVYQFAFESKFNSTIPYKTTSFASFFACSPKDWEEARDPNEPEPPSSGLSLDDVTPAKADIDVWPGNATHPIRIPPAPGGGTSRNGLSPGLIIGYVVGALVLIVAIIALVFLYRAKKQGKAGSTRGPKEPSSSSTTSKSSSTSGRKTSAAAPVGRTRKQANKLVSSSTATSSTAASSSATGKSSQAKSKK